MTSPTSRMGYRCCNEPNCESGLRNNYFEGKRLSVDSFRVEQAYSLERRRLLNRAIHGWGVVYGYAIEARPAAAKTRPRRLNIGAGLALDKCGRELLQLDAPIDVDDLIILDEKGARIEPERALRVQGSNEKCWLLSVHYAERYTASVTVKDPCRCEHNEWDHTCETVRYSLRPISCDECCEEFGCELNCGCGTGPFCDRSDDDCDDKADMPHKRGGCRCLCDYLTNLVPECECGSLRDIEDPCAKVRVDLHNGVPLACVKLVRDESDQWTFGEWIDECGPRRLVKRNDLLFDLIRGCDLTRIVEIGWKDWHRREDPISFDDFSDALGPPGHRQPEYVSNRFWVRFSRPVREDTLRPDCFAMTVMTCETRDAWWETIRVPIVRVETLRFPAETGDPGGHVRGAAIVLDGAWVEAGARGRSSHFHDGETRIELEVRGDLIIDCNGQAVDANAVGLAASPTGNGTPGGTFLSTFRVSRAHDRPYESVLEDNDRRQRGVS